MPAAVGSDNDADGEPEDKDDALAVRGFGSSASVTVAGVGGRWWNSVNTVGCGHGGVGPGWMIMSYLDFLVVAANEVPRLGSGRGGFGCGGGSGSGARR